MHTADIIQAFGGRQPTSAILGVNANAVAQWLRIGIPAKYHRRLVEHAEANGIEGITFDALENAETGTGRSTRPSPDTQAAA